MFFTKNFPLVSDAGQEVGTVVLEHLWADVYGIIFKNTATEAHAKVWAEAVRAALLEAQTRKAREVQLRLVKTGAWQELAETLPGLGFQKRHDRVEFRKPIEQLATDPGSLLTWKTAQELGWDESRVAAHLKLVAQGDPGNDPNEDPLTLIQDFLSDPVLTAGLGCIHIGWIEQKPAALTVVQINPKSGWSRISYMGIAPEFRERGLGKWVHRYSFQVMKTQGGKLYHGGTSAMNLPMIRLFELQGCERFLEMEEWIAQFA
jgi:GNAT superfamily N-acetyltransferase